MEFWLHILKDSRSIVQYWLRRYSWQVSNYGYYHALRNAKIGRLSPVNFACVSSSKWASGVIESDGYIAVKQGGTIFDQAYKEFTERQLKYFKEVLKQDEVPKHKLYKKKDLERRLQKAQDALRRNFSADTSNLATVDKNEYLIGSVYTAQKVR